MTAILAIRVGQWAVTRLAPAKKEDPPRLRSSLVVAVHQPNRSFRYCGYKHEKSPYQLIALKDWALVPASAIVAFFDSKDEARILELESEVTFLRTMVQEERAGRVALVQKLNEIRTSLRSL